MSIRSLISSATADAGRPLEAQHRSTIEECLQTSLRDVRLHISPASRIANEALGSLAFAVNNHICFRCDFDPSGPLFTSLLAHEAVHVVQKRLGNKGEAIHHAPSAGHLEQEACAIAAGVLRGIPASCITPDPSSHPRLFGPAGHYYTAFYTSVAVGFQFETAKSIAFFTQVPDLVEELDAKAEGIGWGGDAAMVYLKSLPHFCSHILPSSYEKFWRQSLDSSIDRMVYAWQIQAGLHALTGGDGEEETAKRTRILTRYKPEKIPEFGLAVHAFGDSFAHRDFHDGKSMYGPPLGHLAEFFNHVIRLDSRTDPHDPDNIVLRPALYRQYGEALYKVLASLSPSKPPVDLETFKNDLIDVSVKETEDDQANTLKEKMRSLCTRTQGEAGAKAAFDNFYDPPDEAIPWVAFRARNPWLDPAILAKCISAAADWCGSAAPFKVSIHGSMSDLRNNLNQSVENFEKDVMTVTGGNLTPEQWVNGLGGGMH